MQHFCVYGNAQVLCLSPHPWQEATFHLGSRISQVLYHLHHQLPSHLMFWQAWTQAGSIFWQQNSNPIQSPSGKPTTEQIRKIGNKLKVLMPQHPKPDMPAFPHYPYFSGNKLFCLIEPNQIWVQSCVSFWKLQPTLKTSSLQFSLQA